MSSIRDPVVTPETIAHGNSKFGELVLRRRSRGRDATPSTVYELISGGVFLMDSEDPSTERRLASESLARVPHPEVVVIGGLGLGFTLMEVVASPLPRAIHVVEIEGKILFDSGEASISKRGEGVLARVGAVLASIEDRHIQVSGHTDNAPISDKLKHQYPTNWELSVARATNVVRFLQEKASLPADRLVASGYGEYQPIASNRTAAGRAKNRRIELLLTPSLAPKRISKAVLKDRHEAKKKDASAAKGGKRHREKEAQR